MAWPAVRARQTRPVPRPASGAAARAGWAAALALGVLLSAACSPGYPTGDEPLLTPYEMNTAQRLATMNRIGDRSGPEQRWHYAMAAACFLEVSVRGTGTAGEAVALPLHGAEVEMSLNNINKTYGIALQLMDSQSTEKIPVLLGGQWVDAVQMRSLLQNLQRSCKPATQPVARQAGS